MSARPFDAVVFDLDGTLVESDGDIARAVNAMLVALGRAPRSRAQIRASIGHGARHLVECFLGGEDPALVDRGRELFTDAYAEAPVAETRVYPGIAVLLAELAAADVAVAVATNKPARLTEPVIRGTNLPALGVRAWASADETGRRKPDPAVLALALDRLGRAALPPPRVAYVGDMAVDLETADRFGAAGFQVSWGFAPCADATRWTQDTTDLCRRLVGER
jgi:phosphoglycolate phosphatase